MWSYPECDKIVTFFLFHFFPSLSSADDVQSIVSGKLALRHAGPSVEALKSIANASKNRSLSEFQDVSELKVIV